MRCLSFWMVLLVAVVAVGCGDSSSSKPWLSDTSGGWDSGGADGGDVEAPAPDVSVPEVKADVPKPEDVQEDIPEGPKPGGPCETNGDCYLAPCVPTPAGLQCSMVCEDGCAGVPDWTCYPKVDQWAPGLCLQPDWILCHPCKDAVDCIEPWSKAHYTCVDFDNGSRFCAKDCEEDTDCPAGYECRESTSQGEPVESKQCVPTDGECECEGFHLGASSVCANTNEFGTCDGQLECTAEGFLCDAPEPLEEVCNNKDDNCNGKVDEEMGTVSCGVGICEHEVAACENGFPAFCNPMEGSQEEQCNGVDDNCNGDVDEAWPQLGDSCDSDDADFCSNGKYECSEDGSGVVCAGDTEPTEEVCDGVDNDCDGQVDENQGTASCGVGVCAKTVPLCVDGEPQECDPDAGAEEEDLPDLDGIDSNCDGVDGDAALAIFVDVVTGNDATGDGTPEAPFKTIAAGQAGALDSGKTQIYISKGTYPELFLPVSGLQYYGLFDKSKSWSRSPFNPTYVGAGNPAMECHDQSDIFVEGFTIKASNAQGTAASAYGAWFENCTDVILSECSVQAGHANDGVGGTPGVSGGNGSPGGAGVAGCEYEGWGCGNCSKPAGGAGGGSPCGRNGGNGGAPGARNQSGAAGAGGVGGAGGGAGGSTTQAGSGGTTGAAAAGGTHGKLNGWAGTLDASGFVPASGVNGTNGGNGNGGGGGGGGGGDDSGWNCPDFGGSGGGGGGGGCGGTAGTAGTGGGGSFGIFLIDSDVTLNNTKVYAGNAGYGGAGAAGGKGGSGGTGSNGGAGHGGSGGGGKGGNGTGGGDGGSGSGGPGGPSYGIACIGSAAVAGDTTKIYPGMAGFGGEAAMGGHDGPDGPSAATQGCL